MLTALEISRFKSIREARIEFGRVNLFIGGNGAGKSTILEAAATVSSCIGTGVGEHIFREKGIRLTPPELIKSSFKGEKFPEDLELRAEFSNDIRYEVSIRSGEKDGKITIDSERLIMGDEVLFERSAAGATLRGQAFPISKSASHGMWEYVEPGETLPQHVFEELEAFSQFVIYSPQTEILRGVVKNPTDLSPIGVHGEKFPRAVAEFLDEMNTRKNSLEESNSKDSTLSRARTEKIVMSTAAKLVNLPKWARHFGVKMIGNILTSSQVTEWDDPVVFFEDEFMHSERNELSAYDSSEGTLYLLFAAIILGHPGAPKLFALDNVDNSLNPRITRELVKVIKATTEFVADQKSRIGARQVFLTSHNPTSLDAVDIFDPSQRIFVVDRNDQGHTIIERLEVNPELSKDQWTDLKLGRNLSQLWLDGEIPGALGADP